MARHRKNHRGGAATRGSGQHLEEPEHMEPQEIKKRSRNGTNSHRSRSEGQKAVRTMRYLRSGGAYDMGQQKIFDKSRIIRRPVGFPDQFLDFTKDHKLVKPNLGTMWTRRPDRLHLVGEDDSLNIFITTAKPSPEALAMMGPGGVGNWTELSKEEKKELRTDGAPKYMLMRFSNILSDAACAKFLALFDEMAATAIKYPAADHRRSDTPALHFGVWGLFSGKPHITADSIQVRVREKDRPTVIAAIDALLAEVKKSFIPVAERLMHRHAPEQERMGKRVHDRNVYWLSAEFALRPALDFGTLFSSMAVKEGSSSKIHIDWNDNLSKYALIWVVGHFTGAEFCVPQLYMRIPLRQGMLLAVRTRLLAHCATVVGSGRRVVFTCFTDSMVFEQALKGQDYVQIYS
ncbi:hypothetical protein C8R43DRAFT_963721 [Mycena crocata]|nr:hypothetical protein C8R43DRAFT_963721 [Mycena crocata]